MNRLPQWPERLYETIQRLEGQPFRWGRHDCCLFVGSCLEALCGEDAAAPWRGRYRTEEQALALLEGEFGGGVECMWEIMAARLGFEEIAPAFAQRGDVLLTDRGAGGPALGILGFAGNGLFVLPADMTPLPVNLCRRAWRV